MAHKNLTFYHLEKGIKMKLNKQSIFNKVWYHYVVEGNPYSVIAGKEFFEKGVVNPFYVLGSHRSSVGLFIPKNLYSTNLENYSVTALFTLLKTNFTKDVSGSFLAELEEIHNSSSYKLYNKVKRDRITNFFARSRLRQFRKNIKFSLIAFAVKHELVIPSDRALTKDAKATASIYKR